MKIASDEIETDAKNAAQSYLCQAKVAYFLGFGYHPTNLKQLGIPESINHASVAGTALGKTKVERSRIQADFQTTSLVNLQDVDILQFLRNNKFT